MLVAPATVTAAVPADGSGFGIADDDSIGSAAAPPPSLNNSNFDLLRVKTFRMQIYWNANSTHIERARAAINRVRQAGVGNVVVTFKRNVYYGVSVPGSSEYKTNITRIVKALSPIVDVWGPANEPNGGGDQGGEGWLGGTSNADTLAEYNSRLAEVVAAHDPTAHRTSPDFVQPTDLNNLNAYLNAYVQAGGGWGHFIAFHPYRGIEQNPPSMAGVNRLAELTPEGKPIWITELGADHDPASPWTQNSKVDWMRKTLAQHPRVERVYYYHMRGGASTWDTALLNNDLSRRAAWYTWCTATHGGVFDHPDCAPPPVAPAGDYLGVVDGRGGVWLKNGLPGGQWLLMGASNFAARDVEVDGNRMVVATGDGAVWLKDGLPGAGWQLMFGPEFDARDVEISGGRIAVIAGNGSIWLKEGLPGGALLLMGGTEFAARDIELDGGRLVVAAGNGTVWVKDGLPGAGWGLMFGPEYDARDVEISGGRIAVIAGNGSIWLKEGLPGGALLLMGGTEFAARDIELEGGRLVVAAGNGAVWLKDGLPGSAWQLMFGPEYGTKDVELRGARIGVIAVDGTVWLKDGLPGGPLILLGGSEFAGRDLSL